MIDNYENNGSAKTTCHADDPSEKRQRSRRESISSQVSSSATSPIYDSGNISDLNLDLHHTASISSTEDDSISSDNIQHNSKIQFLLREKEQSLFLALQDVRKLKSELERLSKSEKWYRSELKLQRNSKLEVLEKLYTNERKFTQDNQNLQNERIALYARCSELENQLQHEKELGIKLLKNNTKTTAPTDGFDTRHFELEQNRQRLADQEQLIDILRNQKRSLLSDLQKLSCERDEVVLQLQKNIAQLEDENRTITKRCLQLVESKIALTDEISNKEADRSCMSNEVLDLQIVVKKLQDKLRTLVADLKIKENEANAFKTELSQLHHSEALLLMKHQEELLEKEQSISTLHKTISYLKEEINSLEDLNKRHNEQQCEIVRLRKALEEQTCEIEELKKSQEDNKINQSEEFKTHQNLVTKESEEIVKKNQELQREVDSLKSIIKQSTSHNLEQSNLRKTNQDFDQVSQKYIEVCKLYEKSKFELDMKDISVEKLKFEKEKDAREIKSLREKLIKVSNELDCHKTVGTEFEFLFSKTQQELQRLKNENQCNKDKIVKCRLETSQSNEQLNIKNLEVDDLKSQIYSLKELNAKINSKELATLLQEKRSSQGRIDIIHKMMALQAGKVEQLTAEQNEWQSLLCNLEMPNPLKMPSNVSSLEFDDLNQLFDEQNIELLELNEQFIQQRACLKKAINSSLEENKLLQEELRIAKLKIIDLEKQVLDLENASAGYEREILHLAATNDRLVQEFNEDFSQERESHKKQMKQLKLEAEDQAEKYEVLRQKMQDEIDLLKSSEKLVNCDKNQSQRDAQERILQNVLQTEHQRKMSRYDVHIRSLLSNVKSYKKSLEVAENRCDALITKTEEMVEVELVRAMESDLQDMRLQFENSQKEVDNLKHQLKTMSQQFYVADANKSSNTVDLTNLMDDYKKLIQQSQKTSKRRSTSEIYKLINKSNNFVPKLTNVSTSVDGLREDIQKICTVINLSSPAGRGSPQTKMSLMDELKFADSKK